MNKRISIIIPAYNEARTLPGCLDTIAAQTSMPDEVIVVDNNSSDETVAVAKRYPFVTIIHEPLQGIAFARNAGFNAARGDLLARIDADTHIPRDWVARIKTYYAASTHAERILTGSCYFYNLRSGRLTGRMYDFLVHRLNRVLLGSYFPWGSNSVITRRAWHAVKSTVFTRTDIHEDLDLGIHLKQAGFSTTYLPSLRVGTMARRVLDNHDLLWPYLTWWPRTFKVNQIAVWPFVWPFVIVVWLGGYTIIFNEFVLSVLQYKTRPSS